MLSSRKKQRDNINVLLTKPPVGQYPLGYENYPPMIPMGLAFLAHMLEKNSIEYAIADNYLASYGSGEWDELNYRKLLIYHNPSHVGISAMSIEGREVLKLIEIIRSSLPSAKIIVGGPYAFFAAEQVAPICDYVVIGEGEQALIDILLGTVPAKYRHGKVIKYPPSESLDHLFELPNGPNKTLIPWHEFLQLGYDFHLSSLVSYKYY